MITQLIINSNCYISAITENWLHIDDSALASQLTPDGFEVFLTNKYTSQCHGGLDLLLLSELKLISSSTPCFSSYEIIFCNIQFPSLFTIIIILIYRPPSSSLCSFLADLSSIIEYFTSVNTVILGDSNIQINNENNASLSLNKLIFEYSLTQNVFFTTNTNSNNIDFFVYLTDSK